MSRGAREEGDTHVPVWRQPRGCYGSNYWTVYSPKLRRDVHLYSDLERHHWVLVESDPAIMWFCEAPMRIRIKINGRDIQTIPDMLVRFRDEQEQVREIKYRHDVERQLVNDRRSRQLLAQTSWSQLTGADYQVLTEDMIRANPLHLNNWNRILAHLASVSTLDLRPHEISIQPILRQRPVWQLADIVQACRPLTPDLVQAIVFTLLHRGDLTAPLATTPLDGHLEMWRTYGDSSETVPRSHSY